MKLKLDTTTEIITLFVTEDVSVQHGAILKAGLMKLIQSGKKKVVVDLTGVTKAEPQALKLLLALPAPLKAAGIELIVRGAPATAAPAGGPLSESELEARRAQLESRRDQLRRQLDAASSGALDVKTLRKESSELRDRIAELEAQVRQLLKTRPTAAVPIDPRTGPLLKFLDTILEQQGVLPP